MNRDLPHDGPPHAGPGSFDEALQVQQVLARYVRATDARNGFAMTRLFVRDGRMEVFHRRDGVPALLAEIHGAEAIGRAVDRTTTPHVSRGWSHHTTHDWIVDVREDAARIDAQFVVFESLGDAEPDSGWPQDATGAQGVVRPTDAGYFCASLCRSGGAWKIRTMRIVHDLPFARSSAATDRRG